MANIPEIYREAIGASEEITPEQAKQDTEQIRAEQAETSRWNAWKQEEITGKLFHILSAHMNNLMFGIAEISLRLPMTEENVLRAKLVEAATIRRVLDTIQNNGKYE
jgi:hypothetical protein